MVALGSVAAARAAKVHAAPADAQGVGAPLPSAQPTPVGAGAARPLPSWGAALERTQVATSKRSAAGSPAPGAHVKEVTATCVPSVEKRVRVVMAPPPGVAKVVATSAAPMRCSAVKLESAAGGKVGENRSVTPPSAAVTQHASTSLSTFDAAHFGWDASVHDQNELPLCQKSTAAARPGPVALEGCPRGPHASTATP